MIKIYHNPRCSKSRQCLAILEDKNQHPEIIKYLDTPLNEQELSEIINLLDISPIDLVRKNEKLWKESFKGKDFTDKELIAVMVRNPKLIERPIVIKDGQAIIGRPPEKVLDIL